MEKSKIPELLSLKDFLNKHSTVVTERQMRRILQKRPFNGAGVFVHMVGRRVFIDEQKFFEWTKRTVK